jgi:hypothetical protein
MGGINAMKGRKPPPPAPRMQEMRALVGFRNAHAKSKETYFVAPPEGVSFCAIPTALLESAVWKTLGINERRFADAIHVAHPRAGGRKNGGLTLTHKQLMNPELAADLAASVTQITTCKPVLHAVELREGGCVVYRPAVWCRHRRSDNPNREARPHLGGTHGKRQPIEPRYRPDVQV